MNAFDGDRYLFQDFQVAVSDLIPVDYAIGCCHLRKNLPTQMKSQKLRWNRNYSETYLADREARKLSLAEHGMLRLAWDLLWTQTDRPGYYMIRGRPGTINELLKDIRDYAGGSRQARNKTLKLYMERLFEARLLVRDIDGMICAPHILEEIENSRLNAEHGRKGGNPALKRMVKPEQEEELENNKNQQATAQGDQLSPEQVDARLARLTGAVAPTENLSWIIDICRNTDPQRVRDALDLTTEYDRSGRIRSTCWGFFRASLKNNYHSNTLPQRDRSEIKSSRVKRLKSDLGVSDCSQFDDILEQVVARCDRIRINSSLDALYRENRVEGFDPPDKDSWVNRFLEHLGLPMVCQTGRETKLNEF